MSRVTVTQLQNGTTADATAVNADLNAIANVINGGLDLTNITPASLDNSVFLPAYDPVTRTKETTSNFVVSGLTIPTSGTLSTTIASGIAYVSGIRLPVSAYPITFAASKDTYVDLKSDGTYATVAVNNGATTGMPLTTNADGTNALRIAKVVSSASAVTSVTQTGVDSLFNPLASKLAAALIGLNSGVQSFTNTGTAGGTGYYINLGGIKLCWGITANQVDGIGGSAFTVIPPSSFFSSIQYAGANAANATVDIRHYVVVGVVTTSNLSLTFIESSNSIGGTVAASWLLIGT